MNLRQICDLEAIEAFARVVRENYDLAIRSKSDACRLIEALDRIAKLAIQLRDEARLDIRTEQAYESLTKPKPGLNRVPASSSRNFRDSD